MTLRATAFEAEQNRICFLDASPDTMSLSSGGWTASVATEQRAFPSPVEYGASQAEPNCQTVLMSVRVSLCHSGIRPLRLPRAGEESLLLQLSMDLNKSGEFRLSLQECSGDGRCAVSSLPGITVGLHVLAVAFGLETPAPPPHFIHYGQQEHITFGLQSVLKCSCFIPIALHVC